MKPYFSFKYLSLAILAIFVISCAKEDISTEEDDDGQIPTLTQRPIKDALFSDGILRIYWGKVNENAIGTEVRYTQEGDITKEVFITSETEVSELVNYKVGIAFEYRTLYKSQPNASETFYTNYTEFRPQFPRPRPSHEPSTFVHPGILNSQYDLDYMKTYVNGNSAHPRKVGYQKMVSSTHAKLDYSYQAFSEVEVLASGSTESENHFRSDAHAAYAHALNWVITGNHQSKNKSIEILNAWANTFTRIVSTANTQPTLEASWALPLWVSAAEIIRHYNGSAAGWSDSDINKFKSFVTKLIDAVDGPIASAANWKASRALARMAAGVFLENRDIYNQGYAEADYQISLISSDGKPSENDRDAGHCQYNVIATSQAAEIAFHQGDDVFYLKRLAGEPTSAKPLLFRQSEYFVRELMGDIPQGGKDYSSYQYKHNPPYEMILACYKYDFGMLMPYTEQFVTQFNRPVDISESHFVGWTTLTHVR